MTKKVYLSALALLLALTTLAVTPTGQAFAQADNVAISLAGCTVTVTFVATAQITYFFDVFDGATLLDEQTYTPFSPGDVPANVSFSYAYPGTLPAPSLLIQLSGSDDLLQEINVSGDALTTSCTPPEPGTPPDDSGEPPVTVALASCGPDLSQAVVGSFILPADFYVAPGEITEPSYGALAGQTAWVLGMDAEGEYYKIAWGCQQFWVLAETMAPNQDSVWNGAALPTNGIA